ncbi:MAG: GNAT family N-acetyltransferase [Ktedonobacterales bacterium]
MLSRHPWAYERGALWVMEFDVPATSPVEAQVAATYSEVGAEAAGALVRAMGIADVAVVLDRLAVGSRCFVARVADGIAAYGWVSEVVESIGELERLFHMHKGEAYIWDCATLPEFRRQGLYTSLLHIIATTLQREGTRRLWIGASRGNRPSLRGIASAGFQPVIKMNYVRVFGFKHVWVSDYPGAPPLVAVEARRGLLTSSG